MTKEPGYMELVNYNVAQMASREEGGMIDLFFKESIGGNAGDYNGVSCACTNFHYDRNSGKICERGFTNLPVPEELQRTHLQGKFIVPARDPLQICEIIVPGASRFARVILSWSMKEWNEYMLKIFQKPLNCLSR